MRLPILTLCLFASTALAISEEWTQFRGPSQGHSTAKGLPTEWSETKNIKWKTVLPGTGWSSPVVKGNQIWMTTATEEGVSLRLLCCDLESGKLLMDIEVFRNEAPPIIHKRNSYASPTPIIDGDRIYADFGEWGIACLSTKDGKKIWENRELKVDRQNGPGGCAALYKDMLLIACDGMDQQYGVAIDKNTGQIRWKTKRSGEARYMVKPPDMRKAYGTPIVFQLEGRPQALTCGAFRLYSHDPDNGQELWTLDYNGFSNVPIPVFDGKQIYVCSGFTKGEIWAIKPQGLQGDVTETHVVWKQKTGVPDQSTPVVVGDRLYMITSGGIASCLNTADGNIIWKERVGADFAASPLYVDGKLYLWPSMGSAKVLAPGDTYQQIAKNELADGFMATPAVVGKAFIARTKTALYRIEE